MLEHDLGDERAGLQVAAALELEDVALGADDGALREPREQAGEAGLAHWVGLPVHPDRRCGLPLPVRCRAHPSRPSPLRRLDARLPVGPLVVRELDLHD